MKHYLSLSVILLLLTSLQGQTQTFQFKNGLNGYAGCTDVHVTDNPYGPEHWKQESCSLYTS